MIRFHFNLLFHILLGFHSPYPREQAVADLLSILLITGQFGLQGSTFQRGAKDEQDARADYYCRSLMDLTTLPILQGTPVESQD
jgi:hypothetical protein